MSTSVDIIPLAGSNPAADATVVAGSLCQDCERCMSCVSTLIDIIMVASLNPAAGATVVTGSLCEDYEYTATASVHSILPAIDHMMSQLPVAVRTLNTVCPLQSTLFCSWC